MQPYRVAEERPDPYAAAWSRLRTRRLVRRIAFGAAGFACATLIALFHKWFVDGMTEFEAISNANITMLAAGLGCGVVFLVLSTALVRQLLPSTCPRCHHPFFSGFFVEIGFTKNCRQCGIAVGSPMPSSDDWEPL